MSALLGFVFGIAMAIPFFRWVFQNDRRAKAARLIFVTFIVLYLLHYHYGAVP
jgi:hypothetical protein